MSLLKIDAILITIKGLGENTENHLDGTKLDFILEQTEDMAMI